VVAVGSCFAVKQDIRILPAVVAMGFANAAVAAQLFNRAMQLSMSKTLLVLPLSTATAVTLSAAFLGEWALLNPATLGGLVNLLGTGVTIFGAILLNHRDQHVHHRPHKRPEWLVPVILFIVVNGTIDFFIKVFAGQAIDAPTYVASWYVGTLIGAIPLYFMYVHKKHANLKSIWVRPHTAALIIASGIGIVGSLVVTFMALKYFAASVFFPLQTFANLAAGVLIGLFFFKEYRSLHKNEKLGMLVGAAGALLLLFNN
jgi:drug/metabolite transporter (DMT)-like permease